MNCVDLSRIQEISTTELIYINDSDERISIDLAACVMQYATEYEAANGKKYPANCRCIGNRWVGRYFELYTSPEHTRFTIEVKPLNRLQKRFACLIGWNYHRKDLDRFHRIQSKINEVGFTTFDLT